METNKCLEIHGFVQRNSCVEIHGFVQTPEEHLRGENSKSNSLLHLAPIGASDLQSSLALAAKDLRASTRQVSTNYHDTISINMNSSMTARNSN